MATANIKITALSDITSANMTYQDLLAVVDMNGTPETKKSTVQLVGNLILDGAGGSYFPAAAQAVLAQSVTNAAQPNITSTGTLTSLTVTGNVVAGNMQTGAMTATYFVGDGANLTNVPAGIPSGDGGNLSNLAGANVTGEVPFAAVANSVAVANVSGLGNIATVNLDGNASNILHGDGTWSADATDYSNANVVSLLAAFGSNTISTTGLITGDGGGLSNVIGANVTGEVSFAGTANAVFIGNVAGIGNIAGTDYDGNASNVLHGDGTWSADATDYSNANVVSLLAAFGSNTISTTGLITGDGGGLSNIVAANISGAVANATFADNAGNAGLASIANTAVEAYSVALANVSGAGNIASINLDGNVSNVLAGDGTWIAAASGGTYGDANVVTLLGSFGSNTITTTGNVAFGNVDVSSGDVQGQTGTFGLISGALTSPLQANITEVGTLSNLVVSGNVDSLTGIFNGDGFGLSNIAYANITGTPTLGNISTINIDGDAANVLYGNGVFAAAPVTYGDSNVATLLASFGGNAISTTANISAGNINANTNGFSIGYLEIPQVSLTADDTIALEDSGKHFHSNTAGNITLTIPTNATVAFPVGTAISIVEEAAGNILVNAAAGVNLYLAGNSTAGNRVLATYGMATVMKTGTDTWFINGTGVS